jgi:hypothetical protein
MCPEGFARLAGPRRVPFRRKADAGPTARDIFREREQISRVKFAEPESFHVKPGRIIFRMLRGEK